MLQNIDYYLIAQEMQNRAFWPFSFPLDKMDAWMWSWYSVLGSILLMLLFMYLWDGRRRSKLPPGPPGWPIVGNLFQLGKKPNESLLHLANKYGPLMTLQLGMRTTVVVSSPAMAKEVLKTNDHIFAGRTVMHVAKCLSFNESSMAMAQYGSRWRTLRTLCTTQFFTSKRLEALGHLRRDEAFRTIKLILEDSVKGKHVNIGHTAFLTALNLLGNMIFTQSIFHSHSQDSEELQHTIWRLMEVAAAPNLADFFPFLQILDSQGLSHQFTTNLKRAYKFFDKFIEDRLAMAFNKGDSEKDFLDVLLDFRSDEFTLTDIRAFLVEMFSAGSESTATTVEWAMAELIRNPHTMKRAQQELEEAVGRQRRVEESDIDRLPYLRAVVKEVFRLHPPGPLLLPHRAERSCEIGEFVIPKHAHIIVNVWGMGRNPSIWKDPSEFLPDRLLHSSTDYKGHNFELIPFGTGRRICVGLSLADRMVHLVLASLLHSFDWHLPNGMRAEHLDMTDKFGITLQKAVPLYAIPTPRLPLSLY